MSRLNQDLDNVERRELHTTFSSFGKKNQRARVHRTKSFDKVVSQDGQKPIAKSGSQFKNKLKQSLSIEELMETGSFHKKSNNQSAKNLNENSSEGARRMQPSLEIQRIGSKELDQLKSWDNSKVQSHTSLQMKVEEAKQSLSIRHH